nr:retrotransposon protein, putative, Ty1-copia subclass [Tanacetum cinerariifolium]
MTTLAEYMILFGADNRPPILEKDLYDSWKSIMELYMQNREHERMILESVEHGPLIWPTIEENRVTKTKKYAELSATEKLQADYPGIAEGPFTQSVITHKVTYQANDLDAYDSVCDEISTAKAVLMANLSSYGSDVLSEDTYSSAQQDAFILSVFEQLSNQVTNCNQKQALGFQNLFYLKKAQQIRSMLYDGNVIAMETNVISIDDFEETLMLEEESRSKIMNVCDKSASMKNKKRKEWKPTRKVFNSVGYKWKPTGRTFTLDGNTYPLTRITATKKVPLRVSIPLEVVAPEHVVTRVYTRRPKVPKSVPNSKTEVVQIFLWYSDSGCSKHITEDHSRLTNFVHKFLGTVKFGNDQVTKIMGYGDYQIGNVTVSRVYYVEGLGYDLFSVGQFCDSDIKVAFRKHTCFVHNLEGVDLLSGSRGTNIYSLSIGDMMVKSLASKDDAPNFIIKFLKMIQVRLNASSLSCNGTMGVRIQILFSLVRGCELLEVEYEIAPTSDPKEAVCFYCNTMGLWKRSCPKYLKDLKDRKGLKKSRRLKHGELNLIMGNRKITHVTRIGKFELMLKFGVRINLNNCCYSSEMTRNIISFHALFKDSYKFSFDNENGDILVYSNGCFMFKASFWKCIYETVECISNDGNMILNVGLSNKLDKSKLWHSRLGHINKKRIAQLQKDGVLESFNFKSDDVCESFLLGKMTKSPFTRSCERGEGLLDLVHKDVCRPFRSATKDGKCYYVTFTDNFSRYGYVYLIKHKSYTFPVFKRCQNEVENQLGRKIKVEYEIAPTSDPKEAVCFYCNTMGLWKRSCPKYLKDLKDRKGLKKSRRLKHGELNLIMGNRKITHVTRIGKFELMLKFGVRINLNNCCYSSEMTRNIISFHALFKDSYKFSFDNENGDILVYSNGCFMFKASFWKCIYETVECISNDGNMILNVGLSNKLDKSKLWHSRLGHINKKRIAQLQKDGVLESFNFKSDDVCESFLLGKMTKSPFTRSCERGEGLLDLVHKDVCRPFRSATKDGKCYYVTFTDNFSRYGYVYLIKHKSYTFPVFKRCQNEVENQLGRKIKVLRSDRGGEYLCIEFFDHLKNCDIVSQLTCNTSILTNIAAEANP